MKYSQSAFPYTFRSKEGSAFVSEGMTLRDYFAAKAMQALITRTNFDFEDSPWEDAYAIADAMLWVRKGK